MKKVLLTLLAFLTVGGAWAQQVTETDLSRYKDVMYVAPTTELVGTTSLKLPINLKNHADVTATECSVVLPEGVTVVKDGGIDETRYDKNQDVKLVTLMGNDHGDRYQVATVIASQGIGEDKETVYGFEAGDGVLGYIVVDVSSLRAGTYPVKVVNTTISGFLDGTPDAKVDDEIVTTLTITDRVVLDENSTTAPTAAENVNILVKRTINAGNWSTLCLPFSMTAEQVAKAFGSDVELADYTGWTWTEDDNFDKKSITIQFTSCNTITENKPLIIKTSADISDFTLDGVTINPSEAEIVKKESVDEKRNGTMVGTYVANTKVDEDCLFLSGNNFYYSTGSTKMKAFRAYFDLYYILDEPYKSSVSASNVKISVDGEEATAIDGMNFQRVVEGVYDLSGRKIQLQDGDLNKLQKGVYIIDGKKVTIK